MVNESTLPSHPVTVNDDAAVHVHAVVVSVVSILIAHPQLELALRHNLK